jgi:hypothetical protein
MIVNKKFTTIPFASYLQEEILSILSTGPINGTDLLLLISKKFPISKQGLYKALRQLLEEEVIIKEKVFFSLNKVWLSRLKNFIEHSEQNYGLILPILNETNNQRKVTIFKNTDALDVYWGHLFLSLAETFKDKPFFFFNHHSLFIHERPHSELYLFETAYKKRLKIALTLGADTTVAQKLKRSFSRDNFQIAIDEKFTINKTDNLCIVDDYFIITRYSEKTAKEIDLLFKKNSSFDEEEKKELHRILANCKNPKIIITKNKKKSTIWKHRLAKNFVFKKSEL